MPTIDRHEEAVREWLLGYAWCGDSEAENRASINCIMAQDGWRYLGAQADKFAGQHESGGGPEAFSDGMLFAMSALYECHTAPHTSDCPSRAWEIAAALKLPAQGDGK